jgi:hypothetical protein
MMGLPVPVTLLLMMASWLRGHILALLTLGHRGPRVTAATCVAATSGLVAQHSQYSTCDGSYPPLTGLLRCASAEGEECPQRSFPQTARPTGHP